jgi:hypothetical protein
LSTDFSDREDAYLNSGVGENLFESPERPAAVVVGGHKEETLEAVICSPLPGMNGVETGSASGEGKLYDGRFGNAHLLQQHGIPFDLEKVSLVFFRPAAQDAVVGQHYQRWFLFLEDQGTGFYSLFGAPGEDDDGFGVWERFVGEEFFREDGVWQTAVKGESDGKQGKEKKDAIRQRVASPWEAGTLHHLTLHALVHRRGAVWCSVISHNFGYEKRLLSRSSGIKYHNFSMISGSWFGPTPRFLIPWEAGTFDHFSLHVLVHGRGAV